MNTSNTPLPRSYVVIPARLESTRLPNKMLLAETGHPLVEHTYRNACRARRPVGVLVATDSGSIAQTIRRIGGQAVLTSATCASGTDRVAEAAARLPDAEILVNVQGDEPELDPAAIDQVIDLLVADPTADMATLATPIRHRAALADPACVKVVFGEHGRALYFSRSPIPFVRDANNESLEANGRPLFHQHLGIYAYRRDYLLQLAACPASPLEEAEKLEQLRALERGDTIAVGVVDQATSGIDTPEDYAQFVARTRAA